MNKQITAKGLKEICALCEIHRCDQCSVTRIIKGIQNRMDANKKPTK